MISVDFEWRDGPYSSLPCQIGHLRNRVHCGLRCLSTATKTPATVANIAYPIRATGHSRLEVERAEVE